MIRVLFVCLGNICRSPMAEGVFAHLVAERNLQKFIATDSAGTSRYHIGEQPHVGTLKVLADNGIQLRHAARQFVVQDADAFDVLVAMDADNVRDMQSLFNQASCPDIHYLLDFIPNGPRAQGVPDPWYTGDFQAVYAMVYRACEYLLNDVVAEYLA